MEKVLETPCYFCGDPVNMLGRSTWQAIVGWERKAGIRASGKHGGSDIRLRQTRNHFAHEHCVDLQKRTGNATQQSFL